MPQNISNKRLLIVCQHFWPEQFRINDIVDFLLDNSIEVDILCGRPNYPSGSFYEGYGYFGRAKEYYHGATVYRTLEIPRGNNSNLRIMINYLSYPLFSRLTALKLLRKRYDSIFIYQLSPVMMSSAGILFGRLKKVPVTMYVLDLWPENLFSVLDIQSKILRKMITAWSHSYYKKADKLVALSNMMANHLAQITRTDISRIAIIPQACEKLYEKVIPDQSIGNTYGNGKFNIVFTGNISPAQSFNTMIDAAKILFNKGLVDIHWIIVGDGMSRREVEQRVQLLGLENVFSFEGHRPQRDIPKYGYYADAFVGCLVKSGLLEATIPAKVFSYIAMGKPIILAMDGEVQTLINDTIKCGFAGATEDSTTLARNIERVYKMSRSERTKLGERATSYHYKSLERNVVLSKLEDFLFKP